MRPSVVAPANLDISDVISELNVGSSHQQCDDQLPR